MMLVPRNFNRNGFRYTLVLKGNRSLIYSQYAYGKIIAYEVYKIRYNRKREINGRTLPASYRYPSAEDFGYKAWSFGCFSEPTKALLRAKSKFRELDYNLCFLKN